MSYDTDTETEKAVDPKTGTIRVIGKITLQVDTGPSSYGSRAYADRHEIEFTFGPEANPAALKSYLGNAVAGLLRIENDSDAEITRILAGFAADLDRAASQAHKADADADADADVNSVD